MQCVRIFKVYQMTHGLNNQGCAFDFRAQTSTLTPTVAWQHRVKAICFTQLVPGAFQCSGG